MIELSADVLKQSPLLTNPPINNLFFFLCEAYIKVDEDELNTSMVLLTYLWVSNRHMKHVALH